MYGGVIQPEGKPLLQFVSANTSTPSLVPSALIQAVL